MSIKSISLQNALPSKRELHRLRLKTIRSGDWFRALSRVDRALFDLTLKVVDRVRSSALAEALLSVVKKLRDCFGSRISCALKEFGFPFAHRLGLLAQSWGNKSARNWAKDLSFAGFLAMMHLNTPGAGRLGP